ncbi:MAG: PspC domain-containing protein [Bacteroidales bacterium]|nr:MAG: PspC domain-containing protein [Bacteroidales bacterium]
MKKSIKINLAGLVFNIDEDAYEALKEYLHAISAEFKDLEEGEEIINDIESRIAEIFQAKISEHKKEVINLKDVQEMIGIMGKPEEYLNGEEFQEETKQKRTYYRRSPRRLYRDPGDAVLGGVCGGLGAYFSIDPIWFRIIFIILTLGYLSGVLIYLILWIVVPRAETHTQKLEMRGENITIKNIEKSVKEEYEQVKDNLKKVKKSKGYSRTRNAINDVADLIGSILLAFIKIILIIIGVAFILAGFSVLIGFVGVFFFKHTFFIPTLFDIEFFYFPDFLHMFVEPGNVPFILTALILTVCIPLLALIYGGIKLIFRFKANDKMIGLMAFILWFLSAASIFVLTLVEGVNYSDHATLTNRYPLTGLRVDTIYLRLNENYPELGQNNDLHFELEGTEIIVSRVEDKFYSKPTFDIEMSDNDKSSLEIERRSQGKSRRLAAENAQMINYYWEQQDSLLQLDQFFSLPEGEKWRIPEIRITLLVPEGKSVYIGEEMDEIIYDIENVENIWDFDMVGKMWIMTEDGLTQHNRW